MTSNHNSFDANAVIFLVLGVFFVYFDGAHQNCAVKGLGRQVYRNFGQESAGRMARLALA